MELTRRSFLKGAAALGGAISIGALVGCTDGKGEDRGSSSGVTWDKGADVVVVGGGTGQGAAVAAAHAGMSCLVLEKQKTAGGAMAYSGGCVWMPNTKVAQEWGDSYDNAFSYLKNLQTTSDGEEIIDAFLNNTQNAYELFAEEGIELQPGKARWAIIPISKGLKPAEADRRKS